MLRIALTTIVLLATNSQAFAAKSCKKEAEQYFRNQGYQIESTQVVSKDTDGVVIKVRTNYHGGQAEDLVLLNNNCEILDVQNVWSE